MFWLHSQCVEAEERHNVKDIGRCMMDIAMDVMMEGPNIQNNTESCAYVLYLSFALQNLTNTVKTIHLTWWKKIT